MNSKDDWAKDVLDFWFEELGPEDWFTKSDALDREIERRFGELHARISAEPYEQFLSSPDTAFAAIITLDQFSRNLFRGDARSYASDPKARKIANAMVAKDWDQDIEQGRRVFVYMPFEHSEDLADQDRSVALIEALGDDELDRYAREHRELIVRFGRFPHRNEMLGRVSTPEEEEYLSQPDSGF